LLLLINNQSVLLPPEDEFDEYVANFLPFFFLARSKLTEPMKTSGDFDSGHGDELHVWFSP